MLVQTIRLPGVAGRIDPLGVDVRGQRLFVAALGNNTLEVLVPISCQKIDLSGNELVHDLTTVDGGALIPAIAADRQAPVVQP